MTAPLKWRLLETASLHWAARNLRPSFYEVNRW